MASISAFCLRVLLGSYFSSFRSFVPVGFGVLCADFVVSLFYLCLVVFTVNDRSILCLNLSRNLFKSRSIPDLLESGSLDVCLVVLCSRHALWSVQIVLKLLTAS